MRYSESSVAKKPVLISVLIAITFGLGLVSVEPARAQDSTVNVAICGVGSGAQLTIDQPANDSVTNQSAVHISGQVANATQIDINIDNQYNSTLPLAAQQTSYDTDLQLTPGTHTISLVANDVCQVQNATASVVVTYQPQTTPGSGTDTPTEIGGDDGGVQIGEPPVADSTPIGAESWPVIGPLVQLGRDLAIALDFETSEQDGTTTLWRSVLRFSFMVVGVSVILFGAPAWAWISGSSLGFGSGSGRIWGIRLAGALLVLLTFFV